MIGKLEAFTKKLRQRLQEPLLQGQNKAFDRVVVRLLDSLNELAKGLSSEKQKKRVTAALMRYLMQVQPGFEAAQPLLGNKADEAAYLRYKTLRIQAVAQPCDVVLVRGNQRISRIIQTLTTSPYSHAALYVGDGKVIEVEPQGVLLSPIEKYIHLDIRLCRPMMLKKKGKDKVVAFLERMLYEQPAYDVENIEHLLFKYLYTKVRPDAKLYIGGSTQFEQHYICSGLLAHAFHLAGYPVVPQFRFKKGRKQGPLQLESVSDYFKMVVHYRKNFSQIVPADFDNSPFFSSIKYLFLDEANQELDQTLVMAQEREITEQAED